MWSLARGFPPHPLWATLLFLAVPAFVVNGTSFETDVPFLAFWMAAIALFCADRLASGVLAMVLASLTALSDRSADSDPRGLLLALPPTLGVALASL